MTNPLLLAEGRKMQERGLLLEDKQNKETFCPSAFRKKGSSADNLVIDLSL